MRFIQIGTLFLVLILCSYCDKQDRTDQPENNVSQPYDDISTSEKVDTIFVPNAPNWITRTIIQDQDGNIWLATFEGIIQYDGSSFTNITNEISSSRFFSVLEDRKGNFWFASVGSGVYYYDGESFQNFTTKHGLANNRVTYIFEDRANNIWFGTEGGASYYDGKSFRNFTLQEGLPNNNVSSITEDQAGSIWFGTRYGVGVYDGDTITTFSKEDNTPFKNVRSIVEDSKGNIWLGGSDGLWRYSNGTFANFTRNFIGYIYEDKSGNIWTTQERADSGSWVLSRYHGKFLNKVSPLNNNSSTNREGAVTIIETKDRILFGISEDREGNIWVGTTQGVFYYDGKSGSYFKSGRAF